MRLNRVITCSFVLALSAGASSIALAVPYASGVRNSMDSTWEFVLNEAADSVTVLRDGGNAVNLGAIGPGRHTFDLMNFSTFEIRVEKSAPVGWTSINGPSNPFANFTAPTGLAINNDPSSPYFGAVYIGNSSATATNLGRPQVHGIYPLTADIRGVNLSNFMEVTDANDTSQAKVPGGWAFGAAFASPWRMTLDDSNNLIVSDSSNEEGGIKYASPDLTMGGLVLGRGYDLDGNPIGSGQETGPVGGVFSQEMDEFGRIPLHGSMGSKPYVTGSVGTDLTVWALDEDLDPDLAVPGNDYQSIWRWDVGSATDFDAMAPELVIAARDIGHGYLAINNVRASAHYDEQSDNWYITQYRFNGTGQSGLVVIDADGDGPNLLDPFNPNVLWASNDFTIENNVDGFDNACCPGNDDVLRLTGDVTVSPDGTKLFLHRVGDFGDNPALLNNGVVLIIPLDEEGLPEIEVAGGKLANVEQIIISGNNGSHVSGTAVEFDAAGNLYVTNSATADGGQLMQVFSPGGGWTAITNSNGTFSLIPMAPPAGTAGDYNNNGIVDAADYVVWRKLLGTNTQLENEGEGVTPGMVTDEDYSTWRTNFGLVTPPGAGSFAAVPEPGTVVIALSAVLGAFVRRRQS
ncbi:MAG TPA: hypothetical protein VGK58_02940 [Lacipirellulaceae bacterium]